MRVAALVAGLRGRALARRWGAPRVALREGRAAMPRRGEPRRPRRLAPASRPTPPATHTPRTLSPQGAAPCRCWTGRSVELGLHRWLARVGRPSRVGHWVGCWVGYKWQPPTAPSVAPATGFRLAQPVLQPSDSDGETRMGRVPPCCCAAMLLLVCCAAVLLCCCAAVLLCSCWCAVLPCCRAAVLLCCFAPARPLQ